jgi:hypothetical protein
MVCVHSIDHVMYCNIIMFRRVARVAVYDRISNGMFPVYVEGKSSERFCTATSKKFMVLFISFSIVNFIVGVALLKESRNICLSVLESLYTIRIWSTYEYIR